MAEIFGEYKTLIVFLHVLSAVIWVGGMIAMRYAAHPSFMAIEDDKARLLRSTDALKRLFTIVFPFIIILIITAVFMLLGYDMKNTPYSGYAHAKESIWIVMFIIYIIMLRKRSSAVKMIESGDVEGAKFSMGIVAKYMIPANIVLGLIAIYLGSTLSSVL